MPGDWELDAGLLEAWRGGDDRAGERLFNRHADAVARFFENKLPEGVDDLIQSTFLRMIEGRERIREGVAFRAFVLGIARNVLREHLRGLIRDRQVNPHVDSMATLLPGPSTIAGDRQEQRLLLEALRRLSIDDQVILELFYWEGLKGVEIAAVMDIPASTARSRLERAREQLGKTMAAIAASPDLLRSTLEGLDGWAARLRGRLGPLLDRPLS
ncbi:RNA polymerase sigma factor CarQ [Enhygromyxa salina]|uniref:RNA polymerase sigma factor CarQ n=1 Tax=Enhygromyxa salina TaxID=215803 RepID=A0A2S9YGV3_9BACT|nr:sigma-70 family RNA polymerase sigma factor [Enhygromyxa salina]PRQ04338.1 RNA polymerase sigma factor CarQ [Enhygromyxa salina]